MTLDEVHKLLVAWKVPRLSPHFHVYELRRRLWPPIIRTLRLHEQQRELLRAVRALQWKVFLGYDEKPGEWGAEGRWLQVAHDTWVVPPDASSKNLLDRYLSPGGWTIYLAERPITEVVPYAFERSPKEICEFVRSRGIPVLVQAHADNSEWIVALEPAVVPMARAA